MDRWGGTTELDATEALLLQALNQAIVAAKEKQVPFTIHITVHRVDSIGCRNTLSMEV